MLAIYKVLFIGLFLWEGAMFSFAANPPSSTKWDGLLHRYVDKEGLVNYQGLKQNRQSLDKYLKQLAAVKRPDFDSWSPTEQIAFLINLYNAATVQLILDHYPVSSIKKIRTFFQDPWKQPRVQLFGETQTLDAIEHGLLRKNYAEPRIHFALVCAARGCPPLRSEAFTAVQLDFQLNDQGAHFLRQTSKNRINSEKRILSLSPIFQWYRGDFPKDDQAFIAFLMPYFTPQSQEHLKAGKYRIAFTDYDWALNEQPSSS